MYGGHSISERTVVMGLSMFALSAAFASKYRGIVLLNITIGFFAALIYGSYTIDEKATFRGIPSILLYGVIVLSILEWSWRHFHDDEDCPIYKTFNK